MVVLDDERLVTKELLQALARAGEKRADPGVVDLYEGESLHDLAMEHYRRAIRLNPTVLPPYICLGALYEKKGRREEARKVYEEALAIDPRFAPALNNLAWLYAEQGRDLDRALSLAQRAKERLPEDPSISDTLGWIFYRRGLYPTAIRLLREAVEKAPQNPTLHYHLGLAYRKHGEANSAKGELREALRLNLEAVHAGEVRRLLGEMGEGGQPKSATSCGAVAWAFGFQRSSCSTTGSSGQPWG